MQSHYLGHLDPHQDKSETKWMSQGQNAIQGTSLRTIGKPMVTLWKIYHKPD